MDLRRADGAAPGADATPRVLVAYALYTTVEVVAWVAIILFAYDEGGVGLAGTIAVVQLLPAAVLAPALAGMGDRLPRGRALLLAHTGVAVTCGATALAVVLGLPLGVVIVASGATTVAISVVRPIHFALLPHLAATPDALVRANARSSMADGLGLFAGPLLAGALVQVSGAWSALAVAALAALAATTLCTRLPSMAPAPRAAEASGWREALGGVAALRATPGAVVLLLVFTTRFVIAGALDVLGVAFATDGLHAGGTVAGLVIGAVGIGGLLGGAAATPLARRARLGPVVVATGVAQGLAVALVPVLPRLAPAVLLLAASGAAGAVMMVAGRTLLQRTSDDSVLARVFAVQEATSLLGLSLGAALAPAMVDTMSPELAFAPLGLATVAAVLLAALGVRGLEAASEHRPEEVALLGGIALFDAVPPYDLERIARAASWVDVATGDVVVREGEPGDHWFAIAEGELRVAIAGIDRPYTLGPGEGFGEIALLRRGRRTATVTACAPSRLLCVAGDDFLAAVTGQVDGTALADEIAAEHRAREAHG